MEGMLVVHLHGASVLYSESFGNDGRCFCTMKTRPKSEKDVVNDSMNAKYLGAFVSAMSQNIRTVLHENNTQKECSFYSFDSPASQYNVSFMNTKRKPELLLITVFSKTIMIQKEHREILSSTILDAFIDKYGGMVTLSGIKCSARKLISFKKILHPVLVTCQAKMYKKIITKLLLYNNQIIILDVYRYKTKIDEKNESNETILLNAFIVKSSNLKEEEKESRVESKHKTSSFLTKLFCCSSTESEEQSNTRFEGVAPIEEHISSSPNNDNTKDDNTNTEQLKSSSPYHLEFSSNNTSNEKYVSILETCVDNLCDNFSYHKTLTEEKESILITKFNNFYFIFKIPDSKLTNKTCRRIIGTVREELVSASSVLLSSPTLL